MTDAAAALLDSVPAPEVVAAPAAAADAAPPRKSSRSGTSGAERRRRAKAEETGQPTTASGSRNRATGDRAPKASKTAGAPTKAEVDALVAALDQVLPYLALKDPYSAAVVDKRKREIAGALYAVPVLSGIVRWVAKLQGGADNPYVVLLSVVLPILAHHGKLPSAAAMPVQLVSGLLKLEPTAQEIAAMQMAGMGAVAGLMNLGDVLSSVAAEASVEPAPAPVP
jgi:hypothetical protein